MTATTDAFIFDGLRSAFGRQGVDYRAVAARNPLAVPLPASTPRVTVSVLTSTVSSLG